MKKQHCNDLDRKLASLVASHPGSQPKTIETWLRQFVGRLVSHSPRLICTNCNDEFFAAEIKVRVSHGGVQEECPHCQAGSFRIASTQALVKTRLGEH